MKGGSRVQIVGGKGKGEIGSVVRFDRKEGIYFVKTTKFGILKVYPDNLVKICQIDYGN
jgi:ribosomal protein L24